MIIRLFGPPGKPTIRTGKTDMASQTTSSAAVDLAEPLLPRPLSASHSFSPPSSVLPRSAPIHDHQAHLVAPRPPSGVAGVRSAPCVPKELKILGAYARNTIRSIPQPAPSPAPLTTPLRYQAEDRRPNPVQNHVSSRYHLPAKPDFSRSTALSCELYAIAQDRYLATIRLATSASFTSSDLPGIWRDRYRACRIAFEKEEIMKLGRAEVYMEGLAQLVYLRYVHSLSPTDTMAVHGESAEPFSGRSTHTLDRVSFNATTIPSEHVIHVLDELISMTGGSVHV